MSHQMLRIPVKDLKIIRVKCKGKIRPADEPCYMTYELALADLTKAFPQNCCPVCNTHYAADGKMANVLDQLGTALTALAGMTNRLEVEFDLPVKDS